MFHNFRKQVKMFQSFTNGTKCWCHEKLFIYHLATHNLWHLTCKRTTQFKLQFPLLPVSSTRCHSPHIPHCHRLNICSHLLHLHQSLAVFSSAIFPPHFYCHCLELCCSPHHFWSLWPGRRGQARPGSRLASCWGARLTSGGGSPMVSGHHHEAHITDHRADDNWHQHHQMPTLGTGPGAAKCWYRREVKRDL